MNLHSKLLGTIPPRKNRSQKSCVDTEEQRLSPGGGFNPRGCLRGY